MIRYIAFVALVASAGAACTSNPADTAAPSAATSAAQPAGYTPLVSVNEIMVYVVDSHANEVWDAALKPPTTDEGWRALNRAAVMLAAAGSLTTLGGNGPKDREWVADANWTTHSQKLANAGVDMLNAVRIRSQEQVSRAGDRLVLSCIDCHRQYRLEVPRIWTERPFPPEETQNR